MSAVCPAGHDSVADDYCDVCGLPIDASASSPGTPGSSAAAPTAAEAAPGVVPEEPDAATCPNCAASNPPNALFCEACGYDFTTGTLPRPVDPAPLDLSALGMPAAPAAPATPPETPSESLAPPLAEAWVAEVWIDPDWYGAQDNADPLPSAGVPSVIAIPSTSVLVGRESRSRGIHPGIDLGSDNGISRRHCQLTTDGTRWFVEDLGSSNGTYVGSSVGALPDQPLVPGEKREIVAGERLYLGAWTRIVIRRAQPGEV